MDGSSEGLWQGRLLIILVNLMHLQRHNEATRNVCQTTKILSYLWCLAAHYNDFNDPHLARASCRLIPQGLRVKHLMPSESIGLANQTFDVVRFYRATESNI